MECLSGIRHDSPPMVCGRSRGLTTTRPLARSSKHSPLVWSSQLQSLEDGSSPKSTSQMLFFREIWMNRSPLPASKAHRQQVSRSCTPTQYVGIRSQVGPTYVVYSSQVVPSWLWVCRQWRGSIIISLRFRRGSGLFVCLHRQHCRHELR